MLSGSRKGEGESKRRISTVLAEVEEEHSEKNSISHMQSRVNSKAPKQMPETKRSELSQSAGLEKKKHHKIIVLKDYDPNE